MVTLEFWGAIEVDPRIAPLNDGAIVLEPYLVKITSTNNRPVAKIESRDRGCLNNWQKASDTLEWKELAFAASGTYRLDLYAGSARGNALAKEATFLVDVISPKGASKSYEIHYESTKKSPEMVLGNLSGLGPEECLLRSTAKLCTSSEIEIPVSGTYTIKMKLKDDIGQYFPLRQGRIHKK